LWLIIKTNKGQHNFSQSVTLLPCELHRTKLTLNIGGFEATSKNKIVTIILNL
jgi:hypothetical protein